MGIKYVELSLSQTHLIQKNDFSLGEGEIETFVGSADAGVQDVAGFISQTRMMQRMMFDSVVERLGLSSHLQMCVCRGCGAPTPAYSNHTEDDFLLGKVENETVVGSADTCVGIVELTHSDHNDDTEG